MNTPSAELIKQPAEWAEHRACWLAWPAADDLWQENLPRAQKEFVDLCTVIAQSEKLEILVRDKNAHRDAAEALAGLPVRFHQIPYGDIWMRDIAPVFMLGPRGVHAVRFIFNGWGEKYLLPHDKEVAFRVTEASGLPAVSFDFVLEGGAIESDGEGTLITTEECLLNPNRHENGAVHKEKIEENVCKAYGARKVLWIKKGLKNDHTDGHVDTLARFIKPGLVLCMQAQDSTDPNYEVLEEMKHDLSKQKDASGRLIEVKTVPSPGCVQDEEGFIMPASYMNFYMSNAHVIVPTYGSAWDDEAVAAIAKYFPERKTVGLSAKAILSGGGAFHCITQQEPKDKV